MQHWVPDTVTHPRPQPHHLAVALALVVGAAALGGCVSPRGHEGISDVRICGRKLAGGAAVPEIRRLGPSHDAPPAPRRSVLPKTHRGKDPGTAMLRVIRLTDGCAHGVTVLVTPSGGLRTRAVVRAPDGSLIALCLVRLRTTPATVYAYRNNRAVGQLPI